MTIPAVILGIIISTALGALFHLWRGGSIIRLFLYILISWVGFWVGNFIGSLIGWDFGKYGPLYLLFACLGDVLSLGFGYWLSLMDSKGS